MTKAAPFLRVYNYEQKLWHQGWKYSTTFLSSQITRYYYDEEFVAPNELYLEVNKVTVGRAVEALSCYYGL